MARVSIQIFKHAHESIESQTYSDIHTLSRYQFQAAHDILLHFDQLRQLPREIGSKYDSILAKCMPLSHFIGLAFITQYEAVMKKLFIHSDDARETAAIIERIEKYDKKHSSDSPMFPLLNSLLVLVVDAGGAGFSACAAVGKRVVRMEYVRCIILGRFIPLKELYLLTTQRGSHRPECGTKEEEKAHEKSKRGRRRVRLD